MRSDGHFLLQIAPGLLEMVFESYDAVTELYDKGMLIENHDLVIFRSLDGRRFYNLSNVTSAIVKESGRTVVVSTDTGAFTFRQVFA